MPEIKPTSYNFIIKKNKGQHDKTKIDRLTLKCNSYFLLEVHSNTSYGEKASNSKPQLRKIKLQLTLLNAKTHCQWKTIRTPNYLALDEPSKFTFR